VYTFIPRPKVPMNIFYLENMLVVFFEDLRKMKAPNSSPSQC
jgi:hypothetical protein